MIPRVRFGKTGLEVTRIGLGGAPFGFANKARGWDPASPEGRPAALATVRAALDAGINYIDTAPTYGPGTSEGIIGEAIEGRRDHLILATKTRHWGAGPEEIIGGVEDSLRRLRTDHVDILQFHGSLWRQEQVDHIVRDGLLGAYLRLKEQGKTRFLGFTVEEPLTALPLLATRQFDMIQVRYNIMYQDAAIHVLNQSKAEDMGVAVMRPLTSGIFERIARALAPGWQEAHDIFEVALKYVLADSRVHVANLGMRSPEEALENARLAESFHPPFDMADLPRLLARSYEMEDRGE